jgi:ABC-type glycerol-3-phosphate transport system substrate-binding protein
MAAIKLAFSSALAALAVTSVYAQDVPNTNRIDVVLGVGADLAAIERAVDMYWKPKHPGVEIVWNDGKLEDIITVRTRAGDYPDITQLYQIGCSTISWIMAFPF